MRISCSIPQYLAKRKASEVSYLWDELIEAFIKSMLEGSNLVPDGLPNDLSNLEEGIRHMVMPSRFMRRAYSEAFMGTLHSKGHHDGQRRLFKR